LLDDKGKKEIADKIEKLLSAERDFAENSPLPPAEFAAQGVYCTGDDCHQVAAKWQRPIAEVTPPKSSVAAVWTVDGFGSGKASGGGSAPIHFGDTQKHQDQAEAVPEQKPKDAEVPEAVAKTMQAKNAQATKVAAKVPLNAARKFSVQSPVKTPAKKIAPEKSAKSAVVHAKPAARKARR